MLKTIKIGFIFLLLVGPMLSTSYGQLTKITIKYAEEAYNNYAYKEASELFETAYQRDTTNTYVLRRLSDCYRNLGTTEKVEEWTKKIIERNEQTPEDVFNYSQALKSNGKYEDADKWLKEYAELVPEDSRIMLQSSLLEYVGFLQRDSSRYRIETVSFNSKGEDFCPTLYENKIVFSSTGNPEDNRGLTYSWDNLPFLDMYSVTIDEYGNYSKPTIYAPLLQTTYHDGPASFDLVNNKMYFNRNRNISGKSKKGEDENTLAIYIAEKVNGEWTNKSEFKYNNTNYSVTHPSIDAEGKTLYFDSDMPGGYGKSDLYFCKLENGEWSAPVNLGAKINTEGNEAFPFISDDGVLYFSSDGHGGMGGLDIFMAIPDRDVFAKIENLGYPVNTNKNDFGITLDKIGMHGYFSSDRPGGLGFTDIYKIDILFVPIVIKGTIRDRINNFEIADAKVSLIDENQDTVQTVYSKEDGQFMFNQVNKERNFTVIVTKDDYTSSMKDISTYGLRPNTEVEVELFMEMNFDKMDDSDQLEPLSMDVEDGEDIQIIQIEHINYDYASSDIRGDAKATLDKIVNLIHDYPDLEVRVESHTDSQGSDEYNLTLSKKRARSAYEYLVSRGVNPLTIEYTGYGETQLLNQCENGVECSEEEHAINRRSIIKVIRRGKYKAKRSSRSIFYF